MESDNNVQKLKFYQRQVWYGLISGIVTIQSARQGIESLLPAVAEDPTFVASKLNQVGIGTLLAWGNFFYFLGKCLAGYSVDKLSGRFVFLLSLGISSAFTIFIGLSNSVTTLTFCWCINKLFISSNWPSVAKTMATWFSPERYGELNGMIAFSVRIGCLVSSLLVAELLRRHTYWRKIDFIMGLILILVFASALLLVKRSPKQLGLPDPTKMSKASQGDDGDEHVDSQNEIEWDLITMAKDRVIWLMSMYVAGTTILMELQSFLPLFLHLYMKLEVGFAVYASTIFQIGTICGVMLGSFLYDKLCRKNITIFLNGCMFICTACLVLIWRLLPVLTSSHIIFILFVYGFALAIIFHLPTGVFMMVHVGQRHCGTLIAVLEAFGYLFAVLFDYYGAVAIKVFGWSGFFGLLVLTSMITSLFLFPMSSHPSIMTAKN
ncbi:putative hexose phosphate transport protein [Trichoplax sp. H2]|nr:putative hexose phosphate transport protein [Trichoplax sp. H2]|eukprot:RDD37675.1 putative hexose phosphate transport protein [Trichoplax sp. H2]